MGFAEMHDFSRPMIAGEIRFKKFRLRQHKKNEAEMAGIARVVQKLQASSKSSTFARLSDKPDQSCGSKIEQPQVTEYQRKIAAGAIEQQPA